MKQEVRVLVAASMMTAIDTAKGQGWDRLDRNLFRDHDGFKVRILATANDLKGTNINRVYIGHGYESRNDCYAIAKFVTARNINTEFI